MIDTLAGRIAAQIKQANPEKTASIEVMQFALIIMINGTITFLIALSVGLATGKWQETVLFLAAFIGLRFTTGGFHLDSSVKCTLLSSAIAIIFPQITVNSTIILILGISSLALILLFAPANIEGHTRIPPRFYPMLKILACLLVAGNFFLFSSSLALGFMVQSLTLIHWTRKEVNL